MRTPLNYAIVRNTLEMRREDNDIDIDFPKYPAKS